MLRTIGILLLVSVLLLAARAMPAQQPDIADLRETEQNMEKIADRILSTTVAVSGGSGVVVSADGYVLTAAHISKRADRKLIVRFSDGRSFVATTLGNHFGLDIGLLKIDHEITDPSDQMPTSGELDGDEKGSDNEPDRDRSAANELPPLPFARMAVDRAVIETPCLATGYPISFELGVPGAVRFGELTEVETQVVFSTCHVMGGDSGGGLFGLDGRLLAITSRVNGLREAGVHIPVQAIESVWDELVAGKQFEKDDGSSRVSQDPDHQKLVAQNAKISRRRIKAVRSRAFRPLAAAVSRSVVRFLVADRTIALGTVVGEEGLVVTKASLLQEQAVVRLDDGTSTSYELLAVDAANDLALLRIASDSVVPIAGNSEIQQETSDDEASNPLGIGNWIVSVGPSGQVLDVGIATATEQCFNLVEHNRHAFLGVSLLSSSDLIEDRDNKNRIVVKSVVAGSPADAAGILPDDEIVRLDDRPLRNAAEFTSELAGLEPGTRLKLQLRRNAELTNEQTQESELQLLETTVVLSAVPKKYAGSQLDRWGGSPFSQRRFGFPLTIPHDGVIAPNLCGGPILDSRGSFVGINIANAVRANSLAIPAKIAIDVRGQLIAKYRQNQPRNFSDLETNGLRGTLVLSNNASFSSEACRHFAACVANRNAKGSRKQGSSHEVLILTVSDQRPADSALDNKTMDRLVHELDEQLIRLGKIHAVRSRHLTIDESIEIGGLSQQLFNHFSRSAGAIVLCEESPVLFARLNHPAVSAQFGLLVDSGGTLGLNSSASIIAGGLRVGSGARLENNETENNETENNETENNETGILSQIAIDTSTTWPADGERIPNRGIGWFASEGSSVAITGRRISLLEGEVRVRFPGNDNWPEDELLWNEPGDQADLLSMQRYALRGKSRRFPASEVGAPLVKKGRLIIVGGGGIPKDLLAQFVKLAGGKHAKIVVVPLAAPDPLPNKDVIAARLRKLGAGKVIEMRSRSRNDVDSKRMLEIFGSATGIWFGGGRQWRLMDALEDSKAAIEMHRLLERGGVIAGSSAGASVQGEFLARGNPLGSQHLFARGYERGLGFLNGVVIDQHFSQRDRQDDLRAVVGRYPQLLGIGIDESTAIIVQQSTARVVGSGNVYWHDARSQHNAQSKQTNRPQMQSASAGESINLLTGELDE